MRSLPVRVGAGVLALFFLLSTVACTTDQVLSDIETGLSIAGALVPAVGNVSAGDASVVQLISSLAVAGITDIKAAYDAWTKSGSASDLAKLQATAQEVQASLPSEMASLRITDPATQAKVAAWVNLISSSINSIVAAFPPAAAGSNPAAMRARVSGFGTAAVALPTPESLKARWTAEVCQGNTKCAGLVSAHHAHKHGRLVKVLTFGRV